MSIKSLAGRPGTRIEHDLSTSPGFGDPIAPVEAGEDVLHRHPTVSSVALTTSWSATAIQVPLPLRLWNARCLILNGFANIAALKEELGAREPQPVNDLMFPDDTSGRGLVQLYGSDYLGTTIGPFKAVFTLTWVKPLPRTRASRGPAASVQEPARFMWGPYFGNSLINKEFKEQVWGIRPNNWLAAIETAYYGRRKAVRLLENGRVSLKMSWNSGRFPDVVEASQHLALRTVAPARTYDGENEVEMGAISLKRGDAPGFAFPFDGRDDDFEVDYTSRLGRYLKRIDFTPASWQCMLNYGGVVKFDESALGRVATTGATKPKTQSLKGSKKR
jgi:hypothetical protein